MTMGPVLFDPALDPVNTIAWAWSPDNPVRVSAIVVGVSVAETAGP